MSRTTKLPTLFWNMIHIAMHRADTNILLALELFTQWHQEKPQSQAVG